MATTPATLQDLATQVRQLYLDARSGAQAELAAAQSALNDARAAQTADAAALVALNAGIAGKQAQLAGASDVPVDAAALLEEIAAAQVEARALQAALLDRGDAVATAEAEAAAAQGYLGRVSTAFSRADAAVRTADTDEARRQAWRDAAPALDAEVADAAGHQLDDADSLYDTARDRVVAEVPAGLLSAARKGYGVEARRRNRLERSLKEIADLLADRENTDGGPDGNAAFLRLQLERAEAELGAWSEQAKSRYDVAVAQLTVLAPPVTPEQPVRPPLFTPSEAALLTSLTAAGDAAVALRNPREDARGDLLDARVDARDDATTARADDPAGQDDTGSPPGSPPDDVAAAQQAYDDADADYTAQMRADFAAWSAAVPEAVWRMLVGFVEAGATLQALRTGDSTTLVDAAQDAEAALAAALWNTERHALTVAYLEEQVNLREGLLSRALSVRQQRLLSALRGDA